MTNKTEQWTPEQYQEFMSNTPKRVSKDKKKLKTIYETQELKEQEEENRTLFDISEIETINNSNKEYREIKIILSGEPMPKQSFKSGVQRFKSSGYHKCPYTGNNVYHQAGDVFVYKNKQTGKVDVIPIAYTDAKYKKRTEEYQISVRQQLPDDFVMFTEEVHIVSCEFIHAPLKSFSKKILEGLKNKTLLKYKISRGDLDNNLKILQDSLNGIVYSDDSIIVKYENILKRYGWKPGIIAVLRGK